MRRHQHFTCRDQSTIILSIVTNLCLLVYSVSKMLSEDRPKILLLIPLILLLKKQLYKYKLTDLKTLSHFVKEYSVKHYCKGRVRLERKLRYSPQPFNPIAQHCSVLLSYCNKHTSILKLDHYKTNTLLFTSFFAADKRILIT